MTTAEPIAQHIEVLPEAAQREVLGFVEYLESGTKSGAVREGDATWAAFSLASAMRGMEDESAPYTAADLKESFP